MEPVEIERLAPALRLDVDEFLRDNPDSFAAYLNPRVGVDGAYWWIQYGDNIVKGVAGFGKSIADAFEDFELDCETACDDRLNPRLNGEIHRARAKNLRGLLSFDRLRQLMEMQAFELHPLKDGFELRGGPLEVPVTFHGEESGPAIQMVKFLSQRKGSELEIFNATGQVIETRRFGAILFPN